MKTDNPLNKFLCGMDIDRVKELTKGTDFDLEEALDILMIDYYELGVIYEQLADRQWGLCGDCKGWEGGIGNKYVICLCGKSNDSVWNGWEWIVP